MEELQININLLKKATRRQSISGEILGFSIITMALAASMLGLYLIKVNQLDYQQLLNLRLKNQVKNYVPIQQALLVTGELEKQLEVKRKMVHDSAKLGVPVIKILSAVENAIPPEVMATGVEVNDEKVLVNGYSQQYYGIAQLIAGLAKNAMFTNVALVSSQYEEVSGQIMFSVEMNWRQKIK
ncbi:MAG: PilN domain-containing protein [Syntrophomonas sp.]